MSEARPGSRLPAVADGPAPSRQAARPADLPQVILALAGAKIALLFAATLLTKLSAGG